MGVGNHRRGAAHHHGPGELADAGHGAFDVNVGIDEPGGEEAARQIDGPAGGVFADARDAPAGDGHVAGDDLA